MKESKKEKQMKLPTRPKPKKKREDVKAWEALGQQ